jgi:hypothetical protein
VVDAPAAAALHALGFRQEFKNSVSHPWIGLLNQGLIEHRSLKVSSA